MYTWKYNADHAQLSFHHFHNICWSLGTQRCICCLILISHISIYISICSVQRLNSPQSNFSAKNVRHNNYLIFFLMKWDEKIYSLITLNISMTITLEIGTYWYILGSQDYIEQTVSIKWLYTVQEHCTTSHIHSAIPLTWQVTCTGNLCPHCSRRWPCPRWWSPHLTTALHTCWILNTARWSLLHRISKNQVFTLL